MSKAGITKTAKFLRMKHQPLLDCKPVIVSIMDVGCKTDFSSTIVFTVGAGVVSPLV